MVKLLVSIFFFTTGAAAQEVSVSLDQSFEWAKANYPYIRQQALIDRTESITVQNLEKNFMPQLSLSGQASYQSEVTKIPVNLPNLAFDPPSKDQYKIFGEVNQLIYDGGANAALVKVSRLNAETEKQKLEVEYFKLRERIIQFYFGNLLLQEQSKQVDLSLSDLESGIMKVQAQVDHGTSLRSNLSLMKAEKLKTEQKKIELEEARNGLLRVMELFTGKKFDTATEFLLPDAPYEIFSDSVKRPELALFKKQSALLAGQQKLIKSKTLPKLNAFIQGGYGRPALNMLKNDFDFYYIGGLRLNWTLGNFYTRKNDLILISVNQQILDIQRDLFLLNSRAQLTQQWAEVEKYRKLLGKDTEILTLRHSVTEAAKAQLENAVITPIDYVSQVNAEQQARETRVLHLIQFLQAKVNYQTIKGNAP
jgi:outer membrane protein TolC